MWSQGDADIRSSALLETRKIIDMPIQADAIAEFEVSAAPARKAPQH